jgi:hypothetical protein
LMGFSFLSSCFGNTSLEHSFTFETVGWSWRLSEFKEEGLQTL